MARDTRQVERLLSALQSRRIATARELGEALALSQPSVSRALAQAGTRVARIGSARRARYAAVRDVHGLGSSWPLFRIDAKGRPHAFGELTALHGGFVVRADKHPDWFRDEFAEGLFPGLPWFLDDLRPQGFLGRQFAHRWSRDLGLPADLARWNEDAVVTALLLRGSDGPGDFVLGEAALDQALRHEPETIAARDRARRYALLAEAALAGEEVGSSAAGEQPKFTACVAAGDGTLRHVIVKFSEPVDSGASARRWADLLVCEHLAAELMAAHGEPFARTELVWSGGRLCLEATRFDRFGAHGRGGFVTLTALSDAHYGAREDWPDTAARMVRDGWLQPDALAHIRRRWWFGRMIGNTDMHGGNLGFILQEGLPLSLAPGYDMLPMLFRPTGTGALPARNVDFPMPSPAGLAHWQQAAALADVFWQRVSAHKLVSEDFRRIAGDQRTRLARLRERFGGE